MAGTCLFQTYISGFFHNAKDQTGYKWRHSQCSRYVVVREHFDFFGQVSDIRDIERA